VNYFDHPSIPPLQKSEESTTFHFRTFKATKGIQAVIKIKESVREKTICNVSENTFFPSPCSNILACERFSNNNYVV